MASYNSIQPLSFEIKPDTEGMEIQYERLALPEDYKQEILDVIKQQKPKAKNIPVNNLNRLVRLVLPDVYSIDSYAGNEGKNWLRTMPGSVPPNVIRMLLNAWMTANHFASASLPSVNDLQWISATARLNEWTTHPNGTAKAVDEAVYDLLPNLLVRRIVGQPINIGGNPLLFYQVAKNPGGKGVGLVSWPPLSHQDYKGQLWFYSYYLDIAVATVPFMAAPQINVYIGIRRWVSTYYSYLPNKRLSFYIRAKLPYIKGIQSAHNFQVITAKIQPDGNDYWPLVWSDKLPDMLKFLNLNPELPDPEHLRKYPVEPLKRPDLPNIAMVYSSQMNSIPHEVAAGVSPKDRHDLITFLNSAWGDWLTLVNPRPKIDAIKGKSWEDAFHSKSSDAGKRRSRLYQQHKGAPITIEIHYQNMESREAMLTILAELLDLTEPVVGTHNINGVTLTVVARQLGPIGSELKRTDGDHIDNVVQERRDMIMDVLQMASTTTVALVEILTPKQYIKGSDPKQTLRSAFAHTGRLSQFFHPMDEDERKVYNEKTDDTATKNNDDPKIPYRFTRAVLDALRQLGVHTAGYRAERKRWLLNGWGWSAAGYWLVRQSRKKSKTNHQHFLPTLVLIDGETGTVYAWVSGMEEMRPYHEVLLFVGQGNVELMDKHYQVAARLPQDLDRIGSKDTVLMVDAAQSSMRNKVWRWLLDQQMTLDEIEFSDGQKWCPEDRPRLRVVRVRSSEHETPEWYAEDGSIGLTSGVHIINKRVFASISPTATTQQFSRTLTKTDTSKASKSTPTPGYYELTVGMMQQGDEPEEIAHFVDSLRDGSAQYQDETAHALPLHLGKLIEEYLLWIVDEEDDDETDLNEED